MQWDRETGQSWKSQAYVKFGETICMDRFLDSANPDKRARSKDILSELSKCHDRINVLKTGQVPHALQSIIICLHLFPARAVHSSSWKHP